MPHRVLMYVYRKPGTSPQDFKSHYENVHIPLMRSLAGTRFPRKHSRRYIDRQKSTEASSGKQKYAATILNGSQEDFDYDAIVELEFDGLSDFQEFFGVLSRPDVAAKVKEDCDKFMDQSRAPAAVLDDVLETFGDS